MAIWNAWHFRFAQIPCLEHHQTMNTHHTDFSRRQFVRTAALGAGSLAAGLGLAEAAWGADGAPAEAFVGSNIFGWGQYYQRMNKNLQENFDEVLSALRDAGYDYLEANLDAGNPDANLRLAERMKSKGLKPVTLYTGARLHEPAAARETIKKLIPAAQACRTAGFRALSCNVDPIGREKTEAELKNQVSALIELGQALREIGLKFGIHHHLPEMAAHAREFHYNFQQTDPKTIGFCYDVHWVWKGGVQPLDALKAYGERIVSWHIRQSRDGIWWEDLDAGDVDYSAVAQVAKERRLARLFTVELALEGKTKITRSVVENHRRSREFIRKVFGA
jgi:inosose dehydratase